MSSMASLTTITSNAILPSATLNGNNTTIRNFVNASCLKNDEAGTITSTTATQFTVAYDGSNKIAVDVSSGGVATITATTSITVASVSTFSAAGTALVVTNTASANRFQLTSTNASFVAGSTYISTTLGVVLGGKTGSSNDFTLTNNGGSTALSITTGTVNLVAGGALAVTTTLDVTGNVAVNTNKFNVTASNGNTAIAGTLAVTGATTLADDLVLSTATSARTSGKGLQRTSAGIAGTVLFSDAGAGIDVYSAATLRTRVALDSGAPGAITISSDGTAINLSLTAASSKLTIAGSQVVSTRKTGWTIMTGTPQRGTFATGTVTLAQLAGVVMAMQQDLGITASGHGLLDA